jgi:5'-nucleotidase / UDP-sugar diphosphatase
VYCIDPPDRERPVTTIIATNDFHSSVIDGRHTLDALLAWRARGAILIDSGDFFGGCAFHEFTGGSVERHLYAELYRYVVPGNHDLTDLLCVKTEPTPPAVICANLRPRQGYPGEWRTRALVPGVPTIGLVGLIGQQAFSAASRVDRTEYEFVEPTPDVLQSECELLLAAGAEYLIGVSHSGFEHDLALQERHNLFDLVLAGHCHSGAFVWTSPSSGRHVAKAPEIGAGYLRVELYPDGGVSISVERPKRSRSGALPSYVEEAVDAYRIWADAPIGNLGKAIADRDTLASAVAAAAGTMLDGSVVVNLGAFRAGLPADFRQGDLINAVPFDEEIASCPPGTTVDSLIHAAIAVGERPILYRYVKKPHERIYTTRYLADAVDLTIPSTNSSPTLRSVVTDVLARRADDRTF